MAIISLPFQDDICNNKTASLSCINDKIIRYLSFISDKMITWENYRTKK